jgi:hypothetical protein
MYAQVDLEVIYNRSKNEGRVFNFYEFWSEEVRYKKSPKKKTLVFKHFNLVDYMEQRVVIF